MHDARTERLPGVPGIAPPRRPGGDSCGGAPGREDRKLNELAFAARAEACLTKPFQPDRLINIVNLTLDNAARKGLVLT
jgi:hypothetical protein